MAQISLKKQVLQGTVILAAAGIITRFLGLYNRVFLANVIGAGQMGIYQLIFPVFMVCHAICCSGIETSLARQVAAYSGAGSRGNIRRLVKIAVSLSMGLAAVLALGVFFFADIISIRFLKEPACVTCLKIMAPVIVFSAAHSCVFGYFYGMKRTAVPASTQLIEQIVRVSAIFILSASVLANNMTGAALAVWGMAAGDGIACIYAMIAYKVHVRRLHKITADTHNMPGTYRFLLKRLLQDALPLTVNRLSLTMLQSIESVLIPSMLKLYYTRTGEALEIFGVVTGMTMPFIMFPTTLTNALASMLLPTVAEAAQRSDLGLIRRAVSKSLHYCLLIGMISMTVFVLFGNGIGMVFFKNELAGHLLSTFAFLCPFTYLSAALASVLNGLGRTKTTLWHNVTAVGIRMGFIVICVPTYGIAGYLWGLLAAALVLAAMHIFSIVRISGISFDVLRSLVLPLLACLAGAAAGLCIYQWIQVTWALPSLAVIFIACATVCSIYLLVVRMMGCLKSL